MPEKPSRRGFLQGGLAAIGATLVPTAAFAQQAEAAATATAATEAGSASSAAATVNTTVNGNAQTLAVGLDEVVLDTVRRRLGLTGSKHACGHGACGACTMLVNGKPKVTCLLPTTELQGKEVRTIESIGSADELHPVQKAFIAKDALQCGYCTPGFVVEAVAYFDKKRAATGTERPSYDDVAGALEGHLCRCGAHPRILEAVAAAVAGDFDNTEPDAVRVDAIPKVTGAAKYTTDVQLEGQLDAAVLRSPHAHAIVLSIDLEPARKMPGVKAVVAYVSAGKRVRFCGQELAAVAAVDPETARRARDAIGIIYDLKPSAVGLKAARADGATIVFESPRQLKTEGPSSAEGAVLPAPLKGNLRGPVALPMARTRAANRRLDDIVAKGGQLSEATWGIQTQSHTVLEPHSAVAHWPDPDTLVLHASTQSCHWLAQDAADYYGLKPGKARVLCDFVGGGFGAKNGMHMETRMAADLAKEAGAPVRLVLERSAEIGVAGLRPGADIKLTVGTNADGTLAGIVGQGHNDGGVSVGALSAGLIRLVYKSPFKDLSDFDVLNHTPPCQAFRGPGGPQAMWAIENAVDELAHKRGEDPIALRRIIDPNPNRNRLYDWVESLPAWQQRAAQPSADKGRYRRGFGLANGTWLPLVALGMTAQIDASAQGIVVKMAAQDVGNGAKSVAAYEAARVLGLQPKDITVAFGDSDYPVGPMAGGSRMTVSLGPAVAEAASMLKSALTDAAEEHLALSGVEAAEGGVKHSGGFASWQDVLKGSPAVSVTARRRRDPGGYFLPFAVGGLRIYAHMPTSTQLTEVEVDTRLGMVKVLNSWTGISIGRIYVPHMATTQVEGAVIQGVSYALYEDRRVDPSTGRLLTAGLENYRIAGLGDIPKMHVHFDEEGFDDLVTGGGIGLSELATVGVPASVGNAVYHATGKRFQRMPLNPQQLIGSFV